MNVKYLLKSYYWENFFQKFDSLSLKNLSAGPFLESSNYADITEF